MTAYQDMTPAALACRADDVRHDDTVDTYLGGEDERGITLFFTREEVDITGYHELGPIWGEQLHLIGITLDDAEVLTREQARDMFGDDQIERWEGDAYEVEK